MKFFLHLHIGTNAPAWKSEKIELTGHLDYFDFQNGDDIVLQSSPEAAQYRLRFNNKEHRRLPACESETIYHFYLCGSSELFVETSLALPPIIEPHPVWGLEEEKVPLIIRQVKELLQNQS